MSKNFIILGIILGVISFFSPGSAFMFFVFGLSLFFISRLPDENERRFILRIFSAAFALRVLFVLLAAFFSIIRGRLLNYALSADCPDYSTPYIFGDAGYYTLRALFTKMYWLGEPLSNFTIKEYVTISYGFTGFINILAMFYSLFGYSPVSSNLINSFLGSLTVILVYDMVKNNFGQKTARLSAILMAFFPSLLLWSTANLKEPGTIFITCFILWCMTRYRIFKKFYYLIAAGIATVLHTYIRPSFGFEFCVITLSLILIYVLWPYLVTLFRKRRIIGFSLLPIIFAAGALFFYKTNMLNRLIERVYVMHWGVVNTGGACYKLLPDDFYGYGKSLSLANFLGMFLKGWFHIIFEPLPTRFQISKSLFLSFPQVLIWYLLIPFGILGIAIVLRHKRKGAIFLLMFFLVMTSVVAITGGNIGTIFRLRDEMVTVPFLIFSCVGLVKIFSLNPGFLLKK